MNTIRIPVGPSGKPKAWTTIDLEDYERVAAYRWYLSSTGYAHAPASSTIPRSMFLHGFLLNRVAAGDGLHIDHINRDKLDNRRSNLRVVDCATNAANSAKGDRKRELLPRVEKLRRAGWLLEEISQEVSVPANSLYWWTLHLPVPKRERPIIWTKEAIAQSIVAFHDKHGRLPVKDEMSPSNDLPRHTTVYERFPGGMREAREYAGFGPLDLRSQSRRVVA